MTFITASGTSAWQQHHTNSTLQLQHGDIQPQSSTQAAAAAADPSIAELPGAVVAMLGGVRPQPQSSHNLLQLLPFTHNTLLVRASQFGGQHGGRLRRFEAQQACLVHFDAGKLPQDVIL